MRLSTKSRYGLRALFDIAYNSGNLPAQIQDISRRQEISPRYLEQIFQSLCKTPRSLRPLSCICISAPLAPLFRNRIVHQSWPIAPSGRM